MVWQDFNRWFQRTLGKLLIRRGTTEASVEEGGVEPHFMPMTRRLHWERPLLLPPPPDHGITHGKPVNVKKNDKSIPVPGKNVVKGGWPQGQRGGPSDRLDALDVSHLQSAPV